MRTETFGSVTMILADCMEVMKGYEDKRFSLAVTDPPYGINESAHRNISRSKLAKTKNYRKTVWDQKIPEYDYFNELFRVSYNQIIWGVNYFTHNFKFTPGRVVWYKENGNNDFSDCELAYQSFSKTIKYFKYKWQGMLQEDMKNKQIRIHPTEKPIKLYDWIFTTYTKPGDTILDTHLGSGSSAIAALKAGLTFTGIEIDEEYFNGAVERVRAQYEAMTLGYAKTKLSNEYPTLF